MYGYAMYILILGNAITTASPNPCLPSPCRNGGTCQPNNVGSFMCLCPAGYQGICCETRKFHMKIFCFYLFFQKL